MARGALSLAQVLRQEADSGRLGGLPDFDGTVALRDATLLLTAEERQEIAVLRAEIGKRLATGARR